MEKGRIKKSHGRANIPVFRSLHFSDLISAIKEVTTVPGGECVAEIRVCAMTSVWH